MQFPTVEAAEENFRSLTQAYKIAPAYADEFLARMKAAYDKEGPGEYLAYLNVNSGYGAAAACSGGWEYDSRNAPHWMDIRDDAAGHNPGDNTNPAP